MTSARRTRLLDVSRLLSRAGRQHTGIDRVERAYLERLLSLEDPLFGLARTGLGFLLLDRTGLLAIEGKLAGREPWSRNARSRFGLRSLMTVRSEAESEVRAFSIARGLPAQLASLLKRHLPEGTIYLSVGHASLNARVFRAVKSIPRSRVTVLIHDTIPLDYPEFQRAGTPEKFKRKLRAVAEATDLVLCGSHAVSADVSRHFANWGHSPDIVTAHFGADVANPDPANVAGLETSGAPYFVALGTIEPRKNHRFLCDLWDELRQGAPPDLIPRLLIVGSRGWKNEEVFERLNLLTPDDPISELPGLSDGQVATLLTGAAALLAPSHAEGFGLPLLEAARIGTPIVANDLPVYREYLQDIPVYLDVNDQYQWGTTIRKLAMAGEAGAMRQEVQRKNVELPTWDNHFNRVLKLT